MSLRSCWDTLGQAFISATDRQWAHAEIRRWEAGVHGECICSALLLLLDSSTVHLHAALHDGSCMRLQWRAVASAAGVRRADKSTGKRETATMGTDCDNLYYQYI